MTTYNAVEIPLSKGMFALVSIEDVERVQRYKWHVNCNRKLGYYARGWVDSKHILLHRFILNLPDGIKCDHKNLNPLDCTRNNLRIADSSENAANRKAWNLSGIKGVQRVGKKFIAKINFRGKTEYLGTFSNVQDAALAYDKRAQELHKEFALLNFPTSNYRIALTPIVKRATVPIMKAITKPRCEECRHKYRPSNGGRGAPQRFCSRVCQNRNNQRRWKAQQREAAK